MRLFSVTYETITPESAKHGDAESRGFVAESVTLRDAIDLIGNTATECSSYPFDGTGWISNHEYGHGTRDYYENGREETRSLHIPDNVTASTGRRIARLLGAYGV